MRLKPLAISLGDPAGIGPEVAAKALLKRPPGGGYLCFGDPASVAPPLRRRLKPLAWASVSHAGWRQGRASAASGRTAFDSVAAAARCVEQGLARALVTAPLSKEALHLAGLRYPGHTEILARLAGLRPEDVGMLLVGGPLRVFLVTRHLSLKQALAALNAKALDRALGQCVQGLREHFGLRRPRIALAALNPHAGDGGVLGLEEGRLLRPWLQRRRRGAYELSGPWPADTVFVKAAQGAFDAVLCLYHDQGLIPLKLLAFDSGVNVTLGLPYVRTSPDHGTAYALAGKGKADPGSMLAALELADRLSRP